VLTDGQIRWYDPISHLTGKLEGVHINGLLRFFDTNTYFRQPIVKARPQRRKPLLVEEFDFAKAHADRPLKVVLTGPYTLARHSLEENGGAGGFEKLLAAYTGALGEEIEALVKAGATLIQVEEPTVLRHPEDFHFVERSTTRLALCRGTARLALAVYFADVVPMYDQLQTLPVDILGLDFTYNAELVGVVAAHGSYRTLALGLLDGRNTRLEDASEVARQLEQIAGALGTAEVYLTPSCGLEYLPRDRAQLKLRHLSTIKKTFLGSRG
jgi:5-methyltetrahydropteroyltriglutamate--homocysteine methyltransferase